MGIYRTLEVMLGFIKILGGYWDKVNVFYTWDWWRLLRGQRVD